VPLLSGAQRSGVETAAGTSGNGTARCGCGAVRRSAVPLGREGRETALEVAVGQKGE